VLLVSGCKRQTKILNSLLQLWWSRKKSNFSLHCHSCESRNPVISTSYGLPLSREWRDFRLFTKPSVIEESIFYAQICFHFHQAAEKYLKSFIVAWDLEFKKIHDLPVLLKSCLTVELTLETLMGNCKLLNRFYIDTRYPVPWPTQYSKEEALKARNATQQIRDVIKSSVKSIVPWRPNIFHFSPPTGGLPFLPFPQNRACPVKSRRAI
jgi:HEPN domain-containing protein